MKADTKGFINTINSIKNSLESIAVNIPSKDNIQNTGISLDDFFLFLEEILALLENIDGCDLNPLSWRAVEMIISGQINPIPQHSTNHNSFLSQFNNICIQIWTTKNTLTQITPIHKQAENPTTDFKKSISERIIETEQWLIDAEKAKKSAETSAKESNDFFIQIEAYAKQSLSEHQKISTALAEANTERTNIGGFAINAKADTERVSQFADDLAASVESKNSLFEEFEKYRKRVEELLAGANKAGLASSFSTKRQEQTRVLYFWAAVFVIGIIGLVSMGLFDLLPLLSNEEPSLTSILARFLIASPLIWLSWFAARQYGHTTRIREDYAFKEAAAMAYVGYRDEMGEDKELLAQLQSSAIKNFGSNPTELLLGKSDASSPLHELLDKVLEKVDPKQVAEAITALIKPH